MLTSPELFNRSLTAHLPEALLLKLERCRVLVAGLGGGSNVAELLVRKGFSRLSLADPDVYENHNVRQRGSTVSSWGVNKTRAMAKRLSHINPNVSLELYPEGVTLDNLVGMVEDCELIIDMLDFSALEEKVALSEVAREQGKYLITSPSIVNGAALFVFEPEGYAMKSFYGIGQSSNRDDLGMRVMQKIIPIAPPEAPMEMYMEAARGERTIPLDAVGVDQASVLMASAAENIALGRFERLLVMPKAVQVDVSNPSVGYHVLDFSEGGLN